MDTILAGLEAGGATTAMIAAATIIALLGFTKWAAKKVAGFFG